MAQAFFADSFAIIDFFKGNKNYRKYFSGEGFITARLNLMEVYYWVLSDYCEKKAEEYYDYLLPFCVEIDDLAIKEAMKSRLELKKSGKNVSYVGCIGYQMSLALGVRFLTGDKEFKGLKNVEFVK